MLTIKDGEFKMDGESFRIYSGSMHYFRIMPEYWEDRLRKLKAAGFNTVETYVCWNMHEPRKGEFDFTGRFDIRRFIKTAQEVGLYAIVRPGPYICAEWDFGGLPAWLLKDRNMRLRCAYPEYLQHVSDFYHRLFEEIGDLQQSEGGNIIAMQIENEYGSYGNDKEYLRYIEKLMLDCGTKVMLFTSDGDDNSMLSGAPRCVQDAELRFARVRDIQRHGQIPREHPEDVHRVLVRMVRPLGRGTSHSRLRQRCGRD